jgi:hypothetical protein
MPKRTSHLIIRPTLYIIAVLALLGCGSATSLVSGAATATPIAATATATPSLTAIPGQLVVTVHPVDCGSSSCTAYICHSGTTCTEGGICTASLWPTFTLSNSGGSPVTWNGSFDGHGSSTVGWTLSATTGSLAGGGSTTVTANDDPTMIQTTNPSVVFAAPEQTVTINFHCGIG